MEEKKYKSRGLRLVKLALKQTAKRGNEEKGGECRETRAPALFQPQEENKEPIVIVIPADPNETYNNQFENVLSLPYILNNSSDIINVDSFFQDEASPQFNFPLNAELISIAPYDNLNGIERNETPGLEPDKESGLDLEEKNSYEPNSSEGNSNPQNITNSSAALNLSESDQDEASPQLNLPLNAELISIVPYDNLNGMACNESPGLEPDKESGLAVADKNSYELNLSEGNSNSRNVTNDSAALNLSESDQDATHSKKSYQQRKRSKRGKVDKKSWVADSNKIKRMKGEEYKGRRKNEDGKTVFDVDRQKRQLKPRCSCKITKRNKFKCMLITEERRREIFEYFWNLDWGQRKIEVNHLIVRTHVHQRTVPSIESRRSNSLQYNLKQNKHGERIRVCKKMFLNYTGLREWTVRNWVLKNQLEQQNKNDPTRNDEGSYETANSKTNAVRKLINEFLELLSKLESHFCRKDNTKLYLELFWQSKAQLFREYKAYCIAQRKENFVASSFTFHEVFEAMNLGLFSPKKDQCDLCCAYKQGNVSEEEYNIHIRRKDEAREEKSKDKEECDQNTAVYTMDVQAVLLCPYLKVSALYYRRKLKLHNFTLYNLKTGEGYCYLRDETEGGVNADEFATILMHFITTEINLDVIKHVIIYSDGCTNQNRNVIMANALLLVSHEFGIKITQKYLEKGHTQMECDSIHSNIEKQMKNREIYSPAGYVEIIRTARLNPQPYKVFQLHFSFFKRFNKINLITSIRPGTKKGEPVVTDLRCIQYRPEGYIQVKLNPKDEFFNLPRRIKTVSTRIEELHQLYDAPLSIEGIKFRHLQELKQVIPKDVHAFYDNLPHHP